MITIAVVSYNDTKGREILKRCLDSIENNTRYNHTPYELIIVSDRVGHVRAWNKALRISAPNDVIMLSDDIVLEDDTWIDKLKKTAKEAGVGFSTILADVKERGIFKYDWGLMGFCYLNRDTIERVGYFDEQFFCGYEEDDYCIRMKHVGLKPKMCEELNHKHEYGTTLKRLWGTNLDIHFKDGLQKLREKWGF